MKAIKLFWIIALAAIALVACSLPGPMGTVNLALSDEAKSKAMLDGSTIMRVSLRHHGQDYLFSNGQSFMEGSFEQTMTIDGLPAGEGYDLDLAIGSLVNGDFSADRFGSIRNITVTPGITTSLDLTLINNPVVSESTSGRGLARLEDTLYILEATTVTNLAGVTYCALPAGVQTTSIDAGLDRDNNYSLYLNTNQGIFVSSGGTPALIPGMDTELNAVGVNVADLSVKRSWAVRTSNNLTMVFFNAGGLDLGMGLLGSGVTEWHHLGQSLGAAASMFDSGDDILTSVASNANSYYVASTLNALRIPISDSNFWDYFNGGGTLTPSMRFRSADGKSAVRLLASTEQRLWQASYRGLHVANVDVNGAINTTWRAVPALASETVIALTAYADGSDEYVAAITKNGRLVIILNEVVIQDIPGVVGIPKTNLRLIFFENAGLKVYAAGAEGVMSIPASL